MSSNEAELKKWTSKGQVESTQARVFKVLFGEEPTVFGNSTPLQMERWNHRAAVVLSHVVDALEKSGQLTADQIDQILFDAAK